MKFIKPKFPWRYQCSLYTLYRFSIFINEKMMLVDVYIVYIAVLTNEKRRGKKNINNIGPSFFIYSVHLSHVRTSSAQLFRPLLSWSPPLYCRFYVRWVTKSVIYSVFLLPFICFFFLLVQHPCLLSHI